MRIDKYEKYGKDRYRLYLDNGEVIETYGDVILKLELLFKKELCREDYHQILGETTIQEYYNACQKYISVRLRSVKEIEDYLLRKKVEMEDILLVIERLRKNGCLDDEYFTECFIKDKLKFTTMGKYRIYAELKKHRIDSQMISKYDSLMDDEVMQERIIKIIEKKQKITKRIENSKLRNQLYHHLINLGYPSNLVVEQLNSYFG